MSPGRQLLTGLLFAAVGLGSSSIAVAQTPLEEQVAGRWRWVRSTDFLTGTIETPATTGEEREYVFRSSGGWDQYVNGSLDRSGTWSIEAPPELCGSWGFRIDGFVWCGFVSADRSQLAMDGSFVDGPLEEYEWLGPIPTGSQSWGAFKATNGRQGRGPR